MKKFGLTILIFISLCGVCFAPQVEIRKSGGGGSGTISGSNFNTNQFNVDASTNVSIISGSLQTNTHTLYGTVAFGVLMSNDISGGIAFYGFDSPTKFFQILDGAVKFPTITSLPKLMYLDAANNINFLGNGFGIMTNTTSGAPGWSLYPILSGVALSNSAAIYRTAPKSRAWFLTNSLTGDGDWRSVISNPVRKDYLWIYNRGNAIGAIGSGDAASIGSAAQNQATTNSWTQFSYTTSSGINSNGITGNSLYQFFPGKNCYFAAEGRISLVTTNRTWIGFTSGTGASMGNTDTPTTLSVAALRLSSSASGVLTNWSLVTCDGSGCTVTDGPNSLWTTNRYVFEIVEDVSNSKWFAFMNGTAVATNTANFPTTGMQPIMMITSLGSEAQKTIFGSQIWCENDNRVETGNILMQP